MQLQQNKGLHIAEKNYKFSLHSFLQTDFVNERKNRKNCVDTRQQFLLLILLTTNIVNIRKYFYQSFKTLEILQPILLFIICRRNCSAAKISVEIQGGMGKHGEV